jgi:uncharacterized membrane protein YedE/YeeE
MHIFTAFIAGLIFGIGLIISGMTNPSKIIGFLDITGVWDPSLLLVMVGAISLSYFAYRKASTFAKPLLSDEMQLPKSRQINRGLVLGSLIFGAGWGLAGYCPGPALASIATGGHQPIIFVITMIAGMAIYELMERFFKWKSR